MKQIVSIKGMNCGHCAQKVTETLQALDGISDVAVDLEAGTATVQARECASSDAIRIAVEDIGFDFAGIAQA